ncbi:MAG: ornithine carbamoyltransferase [Bacillota bacterium]
MDYQLLRSLRGRDFLTDQDYTQEELLALLDLAAAIKDIWRKGVPTPLLRGKHLALLFEEPSTRTRMSFEVGMSDLGGTALYLKPGEIHLGARETVGDTARVMSRYVHGIMARLYKHSTLVELAEGATVPVINGLTDLYHPVQTMSDAFTIRETCGKLEGVKVAFLGDATNVCNALVVTCSKLGINLSVANPPGYRVRPEIRDLAQQNSSRSGARIEFLTDPEEAVRDADFVYTDLWWWVGQEDEAEVRKKAMAPYQVNAALMKKAKPTARFMHCLPAARGLEATDEVMDGPQSIIFDQAENRMHFQKALLVALLGVDVNPAELPAPVRDLADNLRG